MERYDAVFQKVERPFAWLDLTALDANIAYVNHACGTKNVRIATKSVRSIEVLHYITRQLDHCSGFMAFTASEALYLLQCGFDNILLGYPVYEPQAIKKLAYQVQQGKDVTFMIDNVQQVELLNKIAKQVGTSFKICIDINVSTDYKVLYFGTKRSPLNSLIKLEKLLEAVSGYEHVVVSSCMAYDAQIAGVTDQTSDLFGMKSAFIRTLKKHSMKKVTSLRQQVVSHLKRHYELRFVNAGGSGSMHLLKEAADITEVTVGSAFFAPALFSQYEALSLQPAAGFALRVTRKFDEDTIICHGGGYVASGATGRDRLPQFLQPQYYSYTSLEGAGEVQTPIQVRERTHDIGDTIYFRHAKAGELCERFHDLHVVRDDKYVGAMQTYRGDGQCFL